MLCLLNIPSLFLSFCDGGHERRGEEIKSELKDVYASSKSSIKKLKSYCAEELTGKERNKTQDVKTPQMIHKNDNLCNSFSLRAKICFSFSLLL
jgi:hypothetical protein